MRTYISDARGLVPRSSSHFFSYREMWDIVLERLSVSSCINLRSRGLLRLFVCQRPYVLSRILQVTHLLRHDIKLPALPSVQAHVTSCGVTRSSTPAATFDTVNWGRSSQASRVERDDWATNRKNHDRSAHLFVCHVELCARRDVHDGGRARRVHYRRQLGM